MGKQGKGDGCGGTVSLCCTSLEKWTNYDVRVRSAGGRIEKSGSSSTLAETPQAAHARAKSATACTLLHVKVVAAARSTASCEVSDEV